MVAIKRMAAALMVLASLLCASCGAPQNGAATQEAATPTYQKEVVRMPGGDLFIAMPAEVSTFDPLLANSEEMINLLSLIYETPLQYNADGSLVGCLVESWKADADKQVFTFTLRENVYFSDGSTRLTADDIVYSATRVMEMDGLTLDTGDEEDTGEPAESEEPLEDAEQDEPQEDENAEGLADAQDAETAAMGDRFKLFSGSVAGIRAVDDRTIELTMDKPGSDALHFMTFPVMSEKFAQASLPVGTGAYKIESYSSGADMVLVRNDAWWNDAAYIEKIVAKPMTGAVQELEFVESRIIDFVTTDALYAGKYKSPGETQVIDYMTNYYDCIVPNLLVDELKDVDVRMAISYAVDRRELLSTVLLNHGVPTNLPIAPDYFASDAKYKVSDYDVAAAKDLLTEAGYSTGGQEQGPRLVLDLLVLDDRNAAYKKEAAKAIKKQLGEVGIEINIVEKQQEEYMLLLESGNFDLAYCSYYMDITPRISFMFDQDGTGNFGSVRSGDIDVAIDAFEAAITDEEIVETCSALQRTLAERVPQIGLYFKTNSIICDESVMGITNQRQNRVFTDIAQWYIGFYTETPQAANETEEIGEAATTEPEAVETEEAGLAEPTADAGVEAEGGATGAE